MPAIYAHMRFGEEVAKNLPAAYANFIAQHPEAFILGTQGPDVLFYHRPLKTNDIRQRAYYFHALSGNELFLAFGEKLLQGAKGEDILTANGAFAAYICGFLCHFTLDASVHLYIDETSCEAVSHGKIESEFDKHLLRKDGKPIRGYNTATPIVDINDTRKSVAKALDLPEETVALILKTMRKYNGWFSKRCEVFHSFVQVALKMMGKNRKFGDMFLHKKDDPLCVETNNVLMVKWQDAIPQAVANIQGYFEHLLEWVHAQHIDMDLFRYDFSGIIKSKE